MAEHNTGVGRGDLDYSFVGLDFDDRLVGFNVLTFGHQPRDDLRLGEAFSDIGKPELSGHYSSKVLLAAVTIRSTLGR